MKNITLYLWEREFPELNLKLDIDYKRDLITFTGSKTPNKLLRNENIISKTDTNDFIAILKSQVYPAIYNTSNLSRIALNIGGMSKNPSKFTCYTTISKNPWNIESLIKLFRNLELNKNVKIL